VITLRVRARQKVRVGFLVGVVALAASVALVGAATSGGTLHGHARDLVVFVALTLIAQWFSLTAFTSSISVAGIGMLAIGFSFGAGPAMATAVAVAGVHTLRKRPKLHKALFNAAAFTLATGAGVGVYRGLGGAHAATYEQLLLSLAASLVFVTVNIGLLTLAMATAEALPPLETWEQRLRWLSPYYLGFGPLALLATYAYRQAGLPGLAALVVPPALLLACLRGSLKHARLSTPAIS
jgi:hypothetical protein